MTTLRTAAAAAGVGAGQIEPVYRTSAFLNVGDDINPVGLGIDVVSIPASRLSYGVGVDDIVGALTREGEYLADSLDVVGDARFLRDEGPMVGISWAVTATAVRALDRRDLDLAPGPGDQYGQVWREVPSIEREIFRLASAPLFVVEDSPPAFHTAASVAAGGISTALYAVGHASAATIVLAPLAIFLITVAPIAGRAFGEYLEDLIRRLPGSGSRHDT